jgi:hypothetical protein
MTRILALAAIAALPFLTAPALGQGVATGAAQAAGTLRVQSVVAALRFVPLQRLPRAPASAAGEDRASCGHLLATPRSPAGRQVAEAGWGVTMEVGIGPYQAVSFVGAFERGTSGSCQLGEGNIGIFRGAELAAIAYAPANASRTIGRVVALEQEGLRIWDGDFLSQPVADLRLGADGSLTILPLAAEEAVCNGAARVPNIYGKPINEARTLLERSGWAPVVSPGRAERERLDGRVAALVRRGVPEVEDCSGTGFGFCGYTYRGAAGTLSVTSVGDDDSPAVSGYQARCGAAR